MASHWRFLHEMTKVDYPCAGGNAVRDIPVPAVLRADVLSARGAGVLHGDVGDAGGLGLCPFAKEYRPGDGAGG